MMRRAAFVLSAALALAGAPARADLPPAAAAADPGENLYQQGLLALSEGRRTDASRVFKRLVALVPRHAGAWLELALLQCSLGNTDEAERLFAIIETRFEPSRDILELISQTREEGCHPWTPSSSLQLSFGRGTDHNVNQGASTSTLRLGDASVELLNEFLPQRDTYVTGGLDYLRDLTANGTLGFVQMQWRRNDNLHAYDTASAFAGVESPYRFGNWAVRATGIAGMVSLDGKVYQRQAQAQLRVGPPLSLPNNIQFYLMGGVTHTDYRRLTNFDARTLELRPELSYRKDGLFASANLGFLSDRGEALRPGGNRHGQLVSLLLRDRLPGDFTGELGYFRQSWRSASAYAPGVIPQVRNQATQVLRAALTYPIDNHQSLQLELRGVRNRENIEIFQYNNRQLQLSWQWRP